MTFDIHLLDGVDPCSEVAEEALEKYQGEVRELFLSSPEGQEFLKQFPDAGSWIDHLIHFGFHYVGVTLAHMKEPDVREIVTDIFPRKVSLSEEEEAEGAIDELIEFWNYLQRQFNLSAAPSIIEFLEHIQPEFVNMMFDPANFGMGKSLFMMAKSSGYDMTNKADAEKFMLEFNSNKEMQNNTDFPTLNIDVPDQSYDRVPQQVVRKEKLGRNEPCSCGSGKKYKKCCGS